MDPITAIAAATTAFNTVKKLISAGREIEDVAGQLGKWFSAVSDIKAAEEEIKNPPLFKRLIHKGSIEEEALNITINKKKILEQESKLREMIMLRYGTDTYREMISLRRKIREQREKEVHRQRRRRKNIIDGVLVTVLVCTSVGLVGFFVQLILNTLKAQGKM